MVYFLVFISLLQVLSVSCSASKHLYNDREIELAHQRFGIPDPAILRLNVNEARLIQRSCLLDIFIDVVQSFSLQLKTRSDLRGVDCLPLVNTVIMGFRPEFRNFYNTHGQTFSHVVTPIHWIDGLLQVMHAQGVDLTLPTVAPDKYPGSTLAHNIAGLSIFQPYGSSCKRENALRALLFLYSVDNGAHFNRRSSNGRTVWQLMDNVGYHDQFPQTEQHTMLDEFLSRINR